MNRESPRTQNPEHHDPIAEIYGILGQMHAGGAMDEEGPFVSNLLARMNRGEISPEEALRHVRAKAQARNEYH